MISATVVKNALKYDDSLDAFGVHGVGGTIGAILTGVFAFGEINTKTGGLYDGNWGQVGYQALATAITYAFAIVGSLILLKIVDVVVGVRVSAEEENEGLDLTQHGEQGYHLESDVGLV